MDTTHINKTVILDNVKQGAELRSQTSDLNTLAITVYDRFDEAKKLQRYNDSGEIKNNSEVMASMLRAVAFAYGANIEPEPGDWEAIARDGVEANELHAFYITLGENYDRYGYSLKQLERDRQRAPHYKEATGRGRTYGLIALELKLSA